MNYDNKKLFLLVLSAMLCAPVLADGFKLSSQDGRYAEYNGSVVLGGRFERRQDAETLDWRGDRVCFFPEAAALKLLPQISANSKTAMFCFANTRKALSSFNLPAQPPAGACGLGGLATVAISHYVVETGSGETYDTATLDHIAKQSPLTPIRCP